VRENIFRALFEARATKERVLHLRDCAEYVFFETNIMSDLSYTLCKQDGACPCDCHRINSDLFSFEIFIIQIGEMTFCKPEFIIIKSNYFQKAQKAFALVRERRFRALVLHNGVRPCNVILKVLSSKRFFSSK
jgi:hypothetical protein